MVLTCAIARAEKKSDDKASGTTPLFSISGEGQLTSHLVERGLSMSNKNPALGAAFLLHMGSQLKLGIWGSNVSYLSNPDDNLWLKFVAEAKMNMDAANDVNVYLHDNHFYTSKSRNGQTLGALLNLKNTYVGRLELGNNFEGTHSNYEYIQGGLKKSLLPNLFLNGYVGYTNKHSRSYYSYLDFKAEAQYIISPAFALSLATTVTSNSSQLSSRGQAWYFFTLDFKF